jgi:hypothetical protein
VSTIDVGSGLEDLRTQLLAHKELFENPDIYEAGVTDTLEAVIELLEEEGG